MSNIDDLLRRANEAQGELNSLRERLSHAHSYMTRRNINARIRRTQDRLDALYAQYLRQQRKHPISVFGTKKKARIAAGLSVRMDVSTDGKYFSNPAPKIGNDKRVWVRAVIDIAQKSPFSTQQTDIPEMIRCTWVVPKKYSKEDRYSRFGRIEPVVSLPLVVTRVFRSPGSGSTKANFGMFADPYYPVDPNDEPPTNGQVEIETVTADIEAGTYKVFTLTGNVFSSATNQSFPDTTINVDEADDRYFYTDGNTYRTLRYMQTGPFPGKYIDVAQDGITLDEVVGVVT